MLAIRMQRVGRKGHPVYRVIVQEAHRQPTSGKVVATLGSYDPHTKKAELDTENAKKYLDNGAQPSNRVVKLFETQKISLPKWVVKPAQDKKKAIRNSEKLRRNQPKVEDTPAEPAQTEETPAKTAE